MGWNLFVQWKNGTEQWIPLKDLKDYKPVEVAEFGSEGSIESEHAFLWWEPFTLRKRDRIIASVISITKRVSHKYGVQLPYTVKGAYDIDGANINNLWRDALNK